MGAQVLSFKPTDAEMEQAWQAYDSARLRVEAMYAISHLTTEQDRRAAVHEANRLHRIFYRLCARAEAAK